MGRIYLRKDQVAIILSEEGEMKLSIPKGVKKMDGVPDWIIYWTGLSILISKNDKRLQRLIKKQLDEFYTLAEVVKQEGEAK
jgi:hypothetical protein